MEPSVEVKSACGQRETQVSEDESFIRYVGYWYYQSLVIGGELHFKIVLLKGLFLRPLVNHPTIHLRQKGSILINMKKVSQAHTTYSSNQNRSEISNIK